MSQYDHLKNKLHHYKVGIDKDKLWKNTSHAIPKRKRRPAVLIMLFAALLISAWLLHSSSILPQSESQSSIHASQKESQIQYAGNLQENSDTRSEELKASEVNANAVHPPGSSASVYGLTISQDALASNQNLEEQRKGRNTFFENTKEISENSQPKNGSTNEAQNNNSILLTNQTGKENNESQNDRIIFNQPDNPSGLLQRKENDNLHVAFGAVENLSKDISEIPIILNTVAPTESLHPSILPKKERLLKSFQIRQGVGFSTLIISSLAPESDQYAAELEQKTRSLEILSTSATATINLPARFSLETGLQWNRLSTVLEHTWETTERVKEEGITTIIIDEHGNPQSITGSSDITRTTHHRAKRFTAHQNIDLVLALHKVIWNSGRTSLDAFVKGAYHFSYNAEGTMLSTSGNLFGFSKDENPFTRISPFTIGGGIQLNYRVSPQWNITSSIVYDRLQYQFNDENIPVQFQHSGFSLGLGMGYVF